MKPQMSFHARHVSLLIHSAPWPLCVLALNSVSLAMLAALLWLLPAAANAQAIQAWVQRYNGPLNKDDQASAIAVDANGDVIVTGFSCSTNWSNGYPDYTTVKYSTAGVPIWTNRYNVPGSVVGSAGGGHPNAMAVDATGDVYVTGTSFNGLNYDYATIKYSSAGVPLWTNRYNGLANGEDEGKALVLDSSGNVYLTGNSSTSSSTINDDYATIAYSSAGVPLWTNRYNGPGNYSDQPTAMAVDASGNVIVTGSSWASGNTDYATIKYSSAGVALWTNRYNGPGNGSDSASAVAVDTNNNVYVTGSSTGNGSGYDFATIKYSSVGVGLWTNRCNGPANDDDLAKAMVLDRSNNVIVAGYSGNYPNRDYATVAYSSAGVPLWTNRYNGPGNRDDQITAVAVDASGNVFVTGYSFCSSSNHNYATIAYSNAGVPLWTNCYSGPGGYDIAQAVAVDASGNVYVTGRSAATSVGPYAPDNWDYATIKYSILRPIPLAIQRLDNQMVLSWTNAAFHLQCAPAVIGPFTNIPGATSPWTNSITSDQQFFRLIEN